jgi:transposase
LPCIEVIYDLTEAEKVCDCGDHMSRIGEKVCEKLDIIPAKGRVIRHIRYEYACKSCEGVDSDLAHMLLSKFEDALPFQRHENILARIGFELGQATICGWAVKVVDRIQPLMALLHQEI